MRLEAESQIVTGSSVPGFILRDVFGHAPTRRLLLHLREAERPLPYTQVREALDEHPEAFHRSVERLEHCGLLGRRALAPSHPERSGRAYRVALELTGLGTYCADLWADLNDRAAALARQHHLPAPIWADT